VGGWYVEQRKVAGSGDLTADIARHLQLRCTAGPAVIITDRPVVFLSVLRKHWLKAARLAQRDRSSTLDAVKIAALTQLLTRMQTLRFSAASTDEWRQVDVSVISPEGAAVVALRCETLYLTVHLADSVLNSLTERLPCHAVVVDLAGNFP